MQITSGEDGEAGKAELENFQHVEKQFPTLVTTSKLLTTGVDAPTVKLIVLDAMINSKTEFKQIIGRGTRIAEKFGKVYFTIMDFRGSTEQFRDDAFDGEPIQDEDFGKERKPHEPEGGETEPPLPPEPLKKYRIDDVEVSLSNTAVRYYAGDGTLLTESFTEYSRKNLQKNFTTLKDFFQFWNAQDKKKAILAELNEKGIFYEQIKDEAGEKFKNIDEFDLLCHLAYGAKPLTRAERAKNVQKSNIYSRYSQKAQDVITALLDKYANEGITAIEETKDLKVKPFDRIGTPVELVNLFGGKEKYFEMLHELKTLIYTEVA